MADHTKCLMSNEGFNVYKLKEHCKKHHNIKDYQAGQEIDSEEFFGIECDIVIPAAKELVICGENANKLNCQLVVEAANGPVDMEAEEILIGKNIEVIPDILANSGGVVVSYYEWLQNKQCEYLEESENLQKLTNQMSKTFNRVIERQKKENCSMRIACYLLAIEKIKVVVENKSIY